MIYLKQSTASQEIIIGPLVDQTDGFTAETGLTIANTDIQLALPGGTTLTSKNSGGATHISGGIYSAVLDATDTATLGSGAIIVHVAGARPFRQDFTVLTANVYDSLIAGTDLLDANTAQWLGTACATPTVAGVPEVDLTHVGGATTNVAALATNVDAILTDTGTTLQAELDGIQADTEDIQTRLPAALVSGRIDASVGAMASGVVTSTAIATDAIGAAEVATDLITEIAGGIWNALRSSYTTAGSMAESFMGILSGSITSGPTATSFVDSSLSGSVDNQNYVGRAVVFITGDLVGQMKTITGYNATTKTLSFDLATSAPSVSDRYVIV